MTAAGARIDVGAPVATGRILVAGIFLACLTDAVASTILALGPAGPIGDTHATPHEFALLDVGYIPLQLIGFVFAPWLITPARSEEHTPELQSPMRNPYTVFSLIKK